MIFSPFPNAIPLAGVVALTFTLLSTPVRAASSEEEAACTPDALRLCSSEIPDVNRITACMERHKASLSPGCRTFFRTPGIAESHSVSKAPKPGSFAPIKSKRANS